MYEGKDTCNQLKAIRKQIADANGIGMSPRWSVQWHMPEV